MTQIELLWAYQQADTEADKLENEMRRSPMRQKLIKYQEYLHEQKTVIGRIEEEVHAMSDRIDALKDAILLTEEQLKALQARFEAERPETSDLVNGYIAEAQRLSRNISDFESEAKHIRRDAGDREHQNQDVRQRAAKARAEYDKLRAEYDIEYKENNQKLESLRKETQEKTVGIEPEYLEKYNTIKQHSVPPLARLQNDQCGGCRMSIPSAILRSIKSGKIVQCETCGRMIVLF